MAQTNYTPIILFNSTTAGNQPTTSNLAVGELALNVADGKLYFNKSGAITVLATAASAAITLPVSIANGGTGGSATPTAGAISYGTGSAYAFTAAGTTGYLLTSAGTSTPTWTATTGSGSVVLASAPTINNQTVTNYTESVVAIGTVTSSNTLSITSGTFQTATLTASTACTFTMPSAGAGKSFILLLKQAASTGNGTATFTGVKWNSAGTPTITATAGSMDILSFTSDGTNWYGNISQGYTP